MNEKWEYKILRGYAGDQFEAECNKLGDDGWEMVSSSPMNPDGESNHYLHDIQAAFKRRKAD